MWLVLVVFVLLCLQTQCTSNHTFHNVVGKEYPFPSTYNTTIPLNSVLTFSFEIQNLSLVMKFAHKGSGWVGVGFNPLDEMKQCDMMVAEIV